LLKESTITLMTSSYEASSIVLFITDVPGNNDFLFRLLIVEG
jgi:hypothetical protein